MKTTIYGGHYPIHSIQGHNKIGILSFKGTIRSLQAVLKARAKRV
jgi:hypothetical protein